MEIDAMKNEKNFKVLSNFMLRTAMLPLESINKIGTKDEFFPSLEKFLDEGIMHEALLIASPSLNEMIEKGNYNQKEKKSVALSLFKYISRTFSRTTPFGLFASIGMGVFGDIRENVDIKNLEFKKNTRIDMEWLLGFIEQIEQNKNIVEQLKVKSNHAVLKVGKRLELLFPTHCGQGEKIRGNISDTISVRLTAASQYVLEKAKKPITFCNLVDDVYELYNKQVARSVIFDFVWEMFRQEFLISELRPPLLGEKPVDYLIAHLSNITGAEKEILFLEKLQEMIAVYDSESLGKGLDRYRFINQQMQEKIKSKSSLQVDTEFSNVVTINKQIADDFEEAIVQMCRITPITDRKSTRLNSSHVK